MKRKMFLVSGLFIGVLLFSLIIKSGIKPIKTWTSVKRLTWNSGHSLFPRLAVDSNDNLHIVWSDKTPGQNEIYYKKSTDGGINWTGQNRMTWGTEDSTKPDIGIDTNDNIYAVWSFGTAASKDIYYKKSTDGGAIWLTKKRVTWTLGHSYGVSIVIDSSNYIHLTWHDPTWGDTEICYKRSTNGGTSWSPLTRLTWNTGNSYYPDMVADSSGNIFIFWHDNTSGNFEIYFKKSTDNGVTWGGNNRLTWNKGNSWYAAVAIDSSNNLHLTYYDNSIVNHEIYYKKSTDGGTSWSPLTRLTWTSGNSYHPRITADSYGQIHVVWYDQTPGNSEIYYKMSAGGTSFSGLKRLTYTSGASWDPFVIHDSTADIHVIWNDATSGNHEIYYKKKD